MFRRCEASPQPRWPGLGLRQSRRLAIDLTNNEFAVTNCVSHPRVAVFHGWQTVKRRRCAVISGQKRGSAAACTAWRDRGEQ